MADVSKTREQGQKKNNLQALPFGKALLNYDILAKESFSQ